MVHRRRDKVSVPLKALPEGIEWKQKLGDGGIGGGGLSLPRKQHASGFCQMLMDYVLPHAKGDPQ